jgi:hypothetical protein
VAIAFHHAEHGEFDIVSVFHQRLSFHEQQFNGITCANAAI